MVELEQQLCELEERFAQAVEILEEANELLSLTRAAANELDRLMDGGGGVEAEKSAWEKIRGLCVEIGEKAPLLEELADLSAETSGGLTEIAKVREQIEAFVSGIGGRDTASGLLPLSGLGDYIAVLTERMDFLEDLPASLLRQDTLLENLGDLKLPAYDETSADERRDVLTGLLRSLQSATVSEERDGKTLPEQGGTREDGRTLGSLLNLKSWLEQGILHLVLPSGTAVSDGKRTAALVRTEREGNTPALVRAYRNLIYGEYALQYTADYTDQGDQIGLIYETEYLIAGGDSDRAASAGQRSGKPHLPCSECGEQRKCAGNCRGNIPAFGRIYPAGIDYGLSDGAVGAGGGSVRCALSDGWRQGPFL